MIQIVDSWWLQVLTLGLHLDWQKGLRHLEKQMEWPSLQDVLLLQVHVKDPQ
jgi:hypothetical protein